MKNINPIKRIVKQAKRLAWFLSFILVVPITGTGQEITLEKAVTPKDVCNQLDVELRITGQPVQRPIEAVLVIDRSGSMENNPLAEAKKAAKEFVKKILVDEYIVGNKVAIVSYSFTATIDIGLSSNYTNVIAQIDALPADGFTNIADGFDKARSVLASQGTFDCKTIRSIILLTDGVANRAPSTYNCNTNCDRYDGNWCCRTYPETQTCCTNAAILSGKASQLINNKETKVYSIGLFSGIDGNVQNVAVATMNQAQNSGFWQTEAAADLSGIYSQISDQLVWAAKNAQVVETINPGYSIIPGSISSSKGETVKNGQVINWNIDYIYEETATLTYSIEANEGTCGNYTPSTGTMAYENSSCTNSSLNFTNPQVCSPCAEISDLAIWQNNTCSCEFNFNFLLSFPESCSFGSEDVDWTFYLDGEYLGTANTHSGTFTIPGGNCQNNSGKTIKGVVLRTFNSSTGCSLTQTDSTEFVIPECCDISVEAGSNEPICEGTTLELSETGGSATSWSWTGPDGFTSSLQNPTISNATTANSGSYKVVATDNNGCVDSATVTVTVNTLPVVNAQASPKICPGGDIILSSTATGNGPFSYEWEGPAGFTSTNQNDTIFNTSFTGTVAFNLKVTDSNGCENYAEGISTIIIETPEVNDIPDTIVCGTYTLPSISGDNLSGNQAFYTETNGEGTKYEAGDLISSSATLYIYDETGTTPNCSDEENFHITIDSLDVTLQQEERFVCDYLDSIKFTGSPAGGTYSGAGINPVTGVLYISGLAPEDHTIYYTYIDSNGCEDTDLKLITIYETPDIFDIPDTSVCDAFVLPAIEGVNLSGNEKYYSGPNGTGTSYTPGTIISNTTTLYLYGYVGGDNAPFICADEEEFTVTVNDSPTVTLQQEERFVCDYLDSIKFTGSPAGGTYSGAGINPVTGVLYISGLAPEDHTIYYTYIDSNGCEDTDLKLITIYETPDIFDIPDTSVCNAFVLPAIEGVNLSGNEKYYSGPNGTGTSYTPGTTISSTTTLYLYGYVGGDNAPFICADEEEFTITIVPTPDVDDISNKTSCDFYILPEITGDHLSGNEAYYSSTNGAGTSYAKGDTIWSTKKLYIFDQTDTDPACSSEENFLVTINQSPDVFDIADTTVCEEFILPTIQGSNLTAHAGYYTQPNGEGTKYSAGTKITSTNTLYIYDETNTDPNCWDQEQFTITVTSPEITLDKTDVLCNGAENGKAWVTVNEGTSPYTYLWNDPAASTTDTANNLPAGWYSVTVTDAKGCPATDSIEVGEPNEIDIHLYEFFGILCYGGTGLAVAEPVTGGTEPYSYLWSSGDNDVYYNAPAGWSYVTITDANGCQATDSIFFTQPDTMTAEISIIDSISCFGENNAELTVTVTGGPGGHSYLWDNGATTKTVSNMGPGKHWVDVNNGFCVASDTIYISQPDTLVATASTVVGELDCYGEETGKAYVSYEGGTPGYSVLWSNNATTDTISNLAAGTYSVLVTDAHGCSDTSSVTITQPTELKITIKDKNDIDCFGGTNGSATAEASGGTPAYTYVWNTVPEQTGATATNLEAGTYKVTVTDANGCENSTTVDIEESSTELVVDITSTNVDCPGDADGTATAQVTGGTAPYAYSWNTNPEQDTKTATGLGIGFYEVVVTDANLCTGSDTVTITQLDTIPPQAVCKDFTARLDADGKVTIAVADVDGGCSDNCADCCDINKYIYPTEFDCSDIGEQKVWLVVSDAAGNKDSCQAIVTVVDEVDPIALCKDTTVYLDEDGQFFLEAENLDNGSFDNCTDVTLEIVPNIMSCDFVNPDQTAENVALFVYDAYGNFDVCIADVTVIDTIAPEIICPDDFNIYKDASCEFVIKNYTNMVMAADNCTIDTITQSPLSGTVIEEETSITFTAYDKSGNSSVCSIVVTPVDEDKPTIICPGNQFVSLDSACGFTLPDYKVLADIYESCASIGGLDTIQIPNPGTIIYDTTEVTLYISDLSGNGDSCSFWVYPSDNTPPEMVCPEPLTVQCIDEVPDADSALVLATDNCDGDVLVTFLKDVWDGNSCPETITRTYQATDKAGNKNTCTQTITVKDTTNPSFTVPADITIYKNDTCGFVATTDITGDVTDEADNCDNNLDATFKDSDITGEECTGTTIILRTWTLADACGNDTIQEQTITVLDTTSPTFTVPSDITVYKDDTCGYVATIAITGDVNDEADNCSSGLDATFTDKITEGSCTDEIIIERTWSLLDDCENTTEKVQVITVKDTLAPVVSCETDGVTTLYVNNNCEVELPSYIDTASITDNCSNAEDITLYQVPAPGSLVSGSESPLEVWVYAKDACGNVDSCSISLTLVDTIPPVVDCPGNDSIPLNENCEVVIPNYTFDLLSDNCTDSTNIVVTQLPVSGTAVTETTRVTLYAEDLAGNMDSCSFDVVPYAMDFDSISCPVDTTIYVDANCEAAIPQLSPKIMFASCSEFQESYNWEQSPVVDSMVGVGTYTVVFSVYRVEELVKTCDVTITVQDTTPPAINCPEDALVNVGENCSYTLADFTTELEVSDNCTATGSIIVSQLPEAGTVIEGHGTEQVVWVFAEDADQNIDSCSFTITLQDTIAPVVECPEDQLIPLNDICEIVVPTFNFNGLTDNCTDSVNMVVSQLPIAGTVISDTTEVTLFATDEAGNSSSCSFNIFPVITDSLSIICPEDLALSADENCSAVLPEINPEVIPASCTDLTNINVVQSPLAGTSVGLGVTSVSISVYEGEELVETCIVNVTVEDNTNPSITCPEDVEITTTPGACEAEVTVGNPVTDDNCEVASVVNNYNNTNDASGVYPVGETTVTWTVTDGSGNTAACSMTVVVLSAPIAVDDQARTPENTPVIINILANDLDCDDLDNTTITIIEQPEDGTVTLIPGTDSVTYTPDNGFDGTDEFVYRVCNTSGLCDSAVVTITIDNTNNPPVAENDINVTDINTPVSGNVLTNDSDPDGDPLTTSKLTDPANGAVTLNPDGTYTYTPNNGFIGEDMFDYTVCDNGGLCDTATVSIEVVVTPPNSVVAVDDNISGKVNTPVIGNVLANDFDPENDNIILNTAPIAQPAHGSVTINADGTFTYTPDQGFVGIDKFTYQICDDNANQACDQAVVTIDVRDIPATNNTTVAVDDVYNAKEGETINGNVGDNDYDPEGDNQIKFTVHTAPANGNLQAFNTATGEFTYVPAEGFTGTDSYTYEVCDDNASQACDIATVIIHYFGIDNLPPVAENDINVTDINTPVSGNVLTNDSDPDGDPLTTSKLTDPANGAVTLNPNGLYTYTPNNGFVGTDEFDYVVCDNGGLCDTATVSIEVVVTPPNSVVAVDDNISGKVNTPVIGNVLANDFDPENDNIILNTAPVAQPAHGSVTINADGTFTYTPDQGFVGIDKFTYQICDDNANQACDQAVVTIDVRDIPATNNTTVAVDDVYNAKEGETINGNVGDNDYDPEGDNQIKFTVLTAPANGNLQAFNTATGEFIYVPAEGFTGTDSYTYEVCDDNASQACDIATVIIHYFADSNLPPLAENDINSTLIDLPVTGNVLTNDMDPDGDPLTSSKLTDPTNGAVTLNPDGSYTYTPNNGFIGEDMFDYVVCDNGGLCDTATVFIAVVENPILNGNRPPEAIDDNTRGKINTPVTGNLIANDFDPDGDIITINTTPVSGPQSGTLTINSDGTFTFVPENGFTGVVTFEYEICDNADPSLCDIALVTIVIEHAEGANTTFAVDDMYQAFNLGEAIFGDVSVNDYDPEGDIQSFTMLEGTSNGLLVFNSNGTFEYTPNEGFFGTESFVYRACDNGTPQACDVATVYILVETPQEALPPVTPQDDNFTATCEAIFGDVLANDDVTIDEITMPTVEQDVQNGTLQFNVDGTFTYTPDQDFIGQDSFIYQICWANEPNNCGTATVHIEVVYDEACHPCPDLFIPDGFSPNGDGNHDYFVVECIENLYPSARLIIFNRWGNLIYEKENYGNTSVWGTTEAYWDGRSQHGWTIGNEKVPVGTYMYVLILDKETVKKGTVYINY